MVGTFFYNLFVFLHIFMAITAVGLNLSYVVWILRGTSEATHLAFALKGVKFLDDYIANPAYIGLAITGSIMVIMGKAIESYLWVALGIYAVAMIVAYGVYTPLLSKQIKVLALKGSEDPEYKTLANRSTNIGRAMGFMVVVILALKLFKPGLW
jgi:Predicted integral membrane protein (DUF2269)